MQSSTLRSRPTRSQQYAAALKLFEAAAQKGNREAQHTLGFMYRDGRGTRRNDAKAIAWYRKAAEQGYAPAEYNLGSDVRPGRGCEGRSRDGREVVPPGGRSRQRRGAGQARRDRRSLTGTYEEAFLWFSKAADQDDADAAFNVGSLYYLGRGVAKDEAKATEYYRKAARLGMLEARQALKSLGQDPD